MDEVDQDFEHMLDEKGLRGDSVRNDVKSRGVGLSQPLDAPDEARRSHRIDLNQTSTLLERVS